MVPSRVVSIAFFGLVQENLSLLSMEIIAYLTSFLLLLHIHSSGKRNAIMFVATVVQLISMETLFFSNKRWHGQALVMLFPEQLPVFTILTQAHFYYMAFVATSRLRIDSLLQPFAMGGLVLLFLIPFEMIGAKFLWWTWHDTDPLLEDRLYGVPVQILYYHFAFGFSFMIAHHLVRWSVLNSDYYNPKHPKREWSYTVIVPLISISFGVFLLILFYHFFTDLIGIDRTTCLAIIVVLSMTICWLGEREKDEPYVMQFLAPVDAYDSDWLYACIDHAINQMIFVYSILYLFLICVIEPSSIISLGHHQSVGNCVDVEILHSLLGIQYERKRYLCVHEYNEDFNLCNYPLTQLHYQESWYMICGRAYSDYATMFAVVFSCICFMNILYYEILKRPRNSKYISFKQED